MCFKTCHNWRYKHWIVKLSQLSAYLRSFLPTKSLLISICQPSGEVDLSHVNRRVENDIYHFDLKILPIKKQIHWNHWNLTEQYEERCISSLVKCSKPNNRITISWKVNSLRIRFWNYSMKTILNDVFKHIWNSIIVIKTVTVHSVDYIRDVLYKVKLKKNWYSIFW